jgi:hypothetical protein
VEALRHARPRRHCGGLRAHLRVARVGRRGMHGLVRRERPGAEQGPVDVRPKALGLHFRSSCKVSDVSGRGASRRAPVGSCAKQEENPALSPGRPLPPVRPRGVRAGRLNVRRWSDAARRADHTAPGREQPSVPSMRCSGPPAGGRSARPEPAMTGQAPELAQSGRARPAGRATTRGTPEEQRTEPRGRSVLYMNF